MNVDALFKNATVLSTEGKNKKAQVAYSEIIDILVGQLSKEATMIKTRNEVLALAYNNRGHLRYLCVDFDEAVDDYTEAIKYDEHLAVAYYNRGQIHYRLGRFSLGITDFKKCLETEAHFTEAQTALETATQDKLEQDKKANINNVGITSVT
ncbi:uncharacterized protein [Antedon mediterranea]|uniref:uncharacterized protein n=1 Tax=Antedon mediterranea TaxID=105859 RepID=UPI003AF49DD4